MNRSIYDLRFAIYALIAFSTATVQAVDVNKTNTGTKIDLPMVLRLAGAQNLDVQLARERLTEAQVAEEAARLNYFPWIAPGVTYRRHEGQIQDVSGKMFRVDKQSYSVGAGVNAQLDLGDAIFKTLAAKQLTKAANEGLAAQQSQSVAAAAQAYFELAKAEALIHTTEEALRISENYQGQVQHAVEAGLAYAGDRLRVAVQTENFRLAMDRAREQRKLASSQLAEILRLKMAEELIPAEAEVVPLTLTDTNAALGAFVQQAFVNRPEVKQSRAYIAAAEENKKGATRGVWIPTIGAQAFAGGLGGGVDSSTGNFSDTADFAASISWRVGPGGILDSTRVDASKSQLKTAELTAEKTRQQIERQVVDAAVQVQSLRQQMESARRVLQAAQDNVQLTTQRKEFAVGVVLEAVQAQEDLAKARADYLATIADYNKAQYALAHAIGQIK